MNTTRVEKPWGFFEQFTLNELSTVKLLQVKKGEETSLQYHKNRTEFWKVMEGNPELTIGSEKILAHPQDEYVIQKEAEHRIAAPTDDVLILEISTGHFDEEDIVRLEDKYKRNS